jgi:hypothetical protein
MDGSKMNRKKVCIAQNEEVFTVERGISRENCFVELGGVDNSGMFASRNFIVYH